MARSGQVHRIFKILNMLNNGAIICMKEEHTTELLNEFDIKLRTLQGDMHLVKHYLGENLVCHDYCYKLINKEYLQSFFEDNHKEIRKFFHAISLIDSTIFGDNFKKYRPFLDSIQAQQKGVYLFLENPFENLEKLNLKKKLEMYIQKRRYINIQYNVDKAYNFKRVQAHKIIYQNGNWYLAVLTTEDYEINSGFKLLRLNFIKNVYACRFGTQYFNDTKDVKKFLDKKFQSLFTSFNKKFFEVVVEVNDSVSRHFEVKKFLKSQRIISRKNNKVLIEFTINDEMEIIPLIQQWLPHIRVVKPLSLHQKILQNIQQYGN